MIEHDIEPEDIFAAMAESLVETESLFRVKQMPDPADKTHIRLKPPREIFYRNTLTYTTKLPPPPVPKRCTCLYLCTGAVATIKCLSCTIYDVKKLGYFCKLCFDARHPWYRVPHIFADIDQDENIEYTLKVQIIVL